jgi:hypothetical protein
MDDHVATLHGGFHRGGIEHVALDGSHMRVLVEPRRPEGIAPEGVEHDDFVVRSESFHQVRADESGAARQENSPSRNHGIRKRTVAHG